MLLFLQPLKSSLCILQAEGNVIQCRPDLFLLQKLHHILEHTASSKIDAPEDAEFPQRAHHVWDLPAGAGASDHPSDCDQAVKPDGAQRLGHRRGPDHVDNVVDAAPLGREASGQFAPVRVLSVIDNMLGTEGKQPVCFCVRARYGDNVGACCNGDL